MKNTIKVVAMTTTILLTAQAEARCSWGFSSCMNPAGTIVNASMPGFNGLDPNSIVHEVKPTMSAQETARMMAEVEALHKKHRESGIKDLDEIFGWNLTSTEAEREDGRCYVKTWYGKKEVNCT